MLFLFAAIICSSSIALIFKYTESNKMNRYTVTTFNYVTAFSISFVIIIFKKLYRYSLNDGIIKFCGEVKNVLSTGDIIFSLEASIIWAIILGIFSGIFYFLSFVTYQKSVKDNGASLSGAYGKMGILVPLLLSIFIWNEMPNIFQFIGIILALIAIITMNISFDNKVKNKMNILLIILLLLNGIAEFSGKMFQKYAVIELKEIFLFFIFFTAFLISLKYIISNTKKLIMKEVCIGLLLGIPNLFSSYFLVLSLNTIIASVVFPAFSAGTIVFISLGSYFIYGEKLSNKEVVSICMAVSALTLLNL